jgi:hypothetical protein
VSLPADVMGPLLDLLTITEVRELIYCTKREN